MKKIKIFVLLIGIILLFQAHKPDHTSSEFDFINGFNSFSRGLNKIIICTKPVFCGG